MDERLLLFLRRKNLSAAKFAEIMEVQSSSISHITSGRNKPSYDFIAKFMDKFPEVNPLWLMLNKGEMLIEDSMESSGTLNTVKNNLLSDNSLFEIKSNQKISTSDDNSDATSTVISNPQSEHKTKQIEKIMVLYTDKSFDIYSPK